MELKSCQMSGSISNKGYYLKFLLLLICTKLVLHFINQAQRSKQAIKETLVIFDFDKHLTLQELFHVY